MELIVTVILLIFGSCSAQDDLMPKIVGGKYVKISEIPYQISLHKSGVHVCGGSIISDRHVLTAAHCTDNVPPEKLTVYAGSKYYSLPSQIIPVRRYKIHDGYNPSTSDNDIALLELRGILRFGPNVLPVALPDENDELKEGTFGTVSGWGHTKEGAFLLSLRVRKVDLPIVSNAKCQRMYNNTVISDKMLCAGYPEGGMDACQGDSGGPLVASGRLYGIVSWGIGCARKDFPGVYTKVSKYRSWIRFYSRV